VLFRRPFKPLDGGVYRVKLNPQERVAMRELCAELRGLVLAGDAAAARLFPPAFRDDPKASAEFDELVRDDLEAQRLTAFDTVEATLDRDRLDEEQAAAWCGALNDARLVLGERLGVTEELYESGISRDDPRAGELAFYAWLTWLQGELVEALASQL
jgi:hypothetical protein